MSLSTGLFGNILEIDKISDLNQLVTARSLVVIDLDDTIQTTTQTLGSRHWFNYRLLQNFELDIPVEEAINKTQDEWEAVLKLSGVRALGEETSQVIQELKERKTSVIGLSSGRASVAPVMINRLLSLDIAFSSSFNRGKDIYFSQDGMSMLFSQGILFAGWQQKIGSFLLLANKLKLLKRSIVYVSSNVNDLVEASQAAVFNGLKIHCVYYNYMNEASAMFRNDIADVQWAFSTLNHLVTDSEAEEYLQWVSPK